MSNYDDDQSEDGELARSPVQDEMDFSLSDEDRDNADSLIIKPPQAVVRPSHRDKRAHKRSVKDRYKDTSRKDKKHLFRDREKSDKAKRDLAKEDTSKDYYREKQYYRDKDVYREKEAFRDKETYRDKDVYREKEAYREKELYRDGKEPYREKDTREKEVYRERDIRDKEAFRDKEVYREKDPYREREHYREREMYRENATFRDPQRSREVYREKEIYKEREMQRDSYVNRERQFNKYADGERKRNDDREMEKRKNESRNELEARRMERRRRGKKRSVSPQEVSTKKSKTAHSPGYGDSVVTVSDASDVEMKSESPHTDQEEGEHTNSETDEDSSSTESDSGEESKSEEEEEDNRINNKPEVEVEKENFNEKPRPKSKSKSPTPKNERTTPSSQGSRRSLSRSKSRSRSHSFSPPPPGENGKPVEEKPMEDEEEARIREEAINALPPYFPALQGCRSVEEFQCLNKIEEGTYGVVYRARDKTTEEIVALKRLKMEKEKEGFPITSLREINTLLKGQHPNIVTVREIVVGSNMDKIFIVMDYVEHDLKSLMETMRSKKQVFLPGEVKCLMTQLLKAVHHLHDNWILHRDLKTSNLLLSHKGVLKVGDFGLAREYGSPLRPYTPIVVTLWYRAPELLLCCKEYSTHIDMWSVGCIFAEFIAMNPLFPGKSEVDQLNRIFKDMGTPSESIWPGYSELPAVQRMTFAEHPAGGLRARIGPDLLSEAGHTLLQGFLTYSPAKRITADAALEHAYFKEQPVAIDSAMFPTWPAKSEGKTRATHSPRPPAGGAAHAAYSRADSDEVGFQLHQRSLNVAPGFSLKF